MQIALLIRFRVVIASYLKELRNCRTFHHVLLSPSSARLGGKETTRREMKKMTCAARARAFRGAVRPSSAVPCVTQRTQEFSPAALIAPNPHVLST
ncbi:Protein of unknown function [Gryllus bimaculatus]|nr:Protein of unknown function [Gryllus bimaculatus]